jgi:hypothetical protein
MAALMNIWRRGVAALCLIGVLLLAATGCATVKKRLIGSERADISSFAALAAGLLAVQHLDFREGSFSVSLAAVNPASSEYRRVSELIDAANEFREQSSAYSVELVRIADLTKAEVKDVKQFANCMEEHFRLQAIENLGVSPEEFAQLVTQLSGQSDLLSAIRSAQPLLARAGRRHDRIMSELEDEALPDLFTAAEARLQQQFRGVQASYQGTERRSVELLAGIGVLRNARQGDPKAWQKLKASRVVSDEELMAAENAGSELLGKVDTYLRDELKKEYELRDLLEPEIAHYQAVMKELRDREEVLEGLVAAARVQYFSWTRAYHALAHGVYNPSKWIEYGTRVADLAKKATSI